MEIINNRYKVTEIHDYINTDIIYKAIDFFNSNKDIYLKVLNYDTNNKKIKCFMNDFIDFSTINHKNILKDYNFSIIKSINNKSVNTTKYFYTAEYFEGDSLMDYQGELNSCQLLDLFTQLCLVCDYLLFKGISKDFIHPKNILISNIDNKPVLKIKDIASMREDILNKKYNTYYNFIKNPEIIKKTGSIDISKYLYGVGKILEFIINSNIYNKGYLYKKNIDLEKAHKKLINIKDKLVGHNIKIGFNNFKDIIKYINNISNSDYEKLMKDTREYLNFNTKIIDRYEEISLIMKNDQNISDSLQSSSIILIDGIEGVGKTRLLSEIEYRLELKNREVYKTKIKLENNIGFRAIKEILRLIIKKYDDKLLNKYGSELVKLIPELKEKYDIYPSESLSGEKEKLRLYDRVANYISNISDNITYIIFDDFHNADKDTYNLVNYMINYLKDYPITIIMTYNYDLIEDDIVYKRYLQNWKHNKQGMKFKLSRFNLDDTSLVMKNILGMDKKPINFATYIYKETNGNPRYIEEVMKNLLARKELYINEEGIWDYKSESYSKIYIPSDINEAIENQLKLLPTNIYNVIEKIAIFNSSISKDIIYKIVGEIKKEELDKIIDQLVITKLIEEKFDDWGHTYDLNNIQIKNHIYYNLTKEERIKLHQKSSNILEKLYEKENRNNIEELIYHLKMSQQYKKAIFYAINFAKTMQKLNINSQSLEIWNMAKDILHYIDNCEYSIEIYINLGNLSNKQGLKSQAIDYYNKALEISCEQKDFINIVNVKNLLGDINNGLAEYDISVKLAMESKQIAEEINYIDGLLISVILINRNDFSKGINKNIVSRSLKYLKIALKHDKYYSIAELYNQLGVISMFNNNLEDSQKYYEKSVFYYKKACETIEVTKPINNLGLIYGEYYGDIDKAMEYFEEGLEISKKYNSLQNEATFLVNIGSMYIRKDMYGLAEKYTHKMLNIAIDIEEKNIISSAYINLANIYFGNGKFDKAWFYLYELKKQFDNGLFSTEEMDQYLEIALKFNFITAQWYECLNICNEIFKRHVNKTNSLYLNALSIRLMINYINDEEFKRNEFYDLINLYNNTKIVWNSRYFLLLWGTVAILKKDISMAKLIINNDEILSKKFNTGYLNLKREVILSFLNDNSSDNMLILYKKAKDMNIPIMELIISKILGDKYYSKNEYYLSANYYLLFIENMYNMTYKLNEESMKINFAKRFDIDEVVNKLNKIKQTINDRGENINYTISNSYNEYFDFKRYEELFNNEKFLNIVSMQHNDSYLNNIKNIDDLLDNLGADALENVDLIIRYAIRETLAERAVVGIYNENNGEFQTLISKGIDEIDEVQSIIEKHLDSHKNGYLNSSVDNNFGKNLGGDFLENTTSMIFLPVISHNSMSENIIRDRRSQKLDYKKVVGYIYLDTDKIFNRFNNEAFMKLKKLAKLILLNIENYKFKRLASIDKLTNVYTRKYMDIVYGELYNKCKKEYTNFSLLMADIDNFKDVNDTYGHPKGDIILKELGNIFTNNVRDNDIVARYGGEEFIFILPLTNKEQAYSIAENIRKKIESKKLLNEPGDITISIGIAQYPIDGQYKDEIIEKADQALYESKNKGRNKTVIWEKSLTESTKRIDKLAGIVTGNTVEDHRIVSVMVEIIELIKEDIDKVSKYFSILGRLIEITEAKEGSLILLNNDKSINKIYNRERFIENWIDKNHININLINNVVKNETGKYLIDWEQTNKTDSLKNNPNWQSVIIVPIILNGSIKGIIQLSVPIKEKEFDYNIFNFVSVISDVVSVLI